MEKVIVMENRMYEDRNEDAIEIDVVELLFALRKKTVDDYSGSNDRVPWGRYIQQSNFKSGLYIHFHGVCIIKGNNTHFPG